MLILPTIDVNSPSQIAEFDPRDQLFLPATAVNSKLSPSGTLGDKVYLSALLDLHAHSELHKWVTFKTTCSCFPLYKVSAFLNIVLLVEIKGNLARTIQLLIFYLPAVAQP